MGKDLHVGGDLDGVGSQVARGMQNAVNGSGP